MSRARGPVELPEFAAMVRRLMRAYAKRVGDADPEDLALLVGLADEMVEFIAHAIADMRATDSHGVRGRSWEEIARALKVTKSAAFQRWNPRVERILKERATELEESHV